MTLYFDDLLSRIREELFFEAVRSRGPGGQNVNKVSSAAVLNWSFESSNQLSDFQKNLIRQKLKAQINKDGQFFLRSDEYRELPRNKERCLEKLGEYLQRAFHEDKPRKASRPTKASKRKKRESKSLRSQTKKDRRKPQI